MPLGFQSKGVRYVFLFFFFSSRRRHTRSLRDWSSDVCSSDLGVAMVDDILDHGDTMCAIRDGLMELGAESFHCAVLVNKRLHIPKPMKADFVGLEIPDRFVFDCGMDAKGYWRNLPEIRAMKGAGTSSPS